MNTYTRRDIEQNELVAKWLEGTSDKPGTVDNYSLALLKYTIFTNRTPEQLIRDERKFQQQDPVTADLKTGAKFRLEKFRSWLREPHTEYILEWERGTGKVGKTETVQKSIGKHARRTIRRTIAACRSFYAFYGISIPRLRQASRSRDYREGTSKHEIARALEFADARERALILVGASTGRSTVDLLKLRVGHINRSRFPGWGFIYDPEQGREKTGVQMISWLTPEALRAVETYLEKRGVDPDKDAQAWLFTEIYNQQEKRLKSSAIRQMLLRLAEKTFTELLDKKGRLTRNPISLRALRSWFGTQLDHVPRAHKEILLGHAMRYEGAYSQPQVNELFESMKQLYDDDDLLRIRATTSDVRLQEMETKLREEVKEEIADELRKRIEELFSSKELLEEQKWSQQLYQESITASKEAIAKMGEKLTPGDVHEYFANVWRLVELGEMKLDDNVGVVLVKKIVMEEVEKIEKEDKEKRKKKKS